MKNGFLYILKDDGDHIYIGSTDDINRRIQQHICGGTYTTRRMYNAKLVFSQNFETLEKARKAELWLKKIKRRDYIEKIIQDGMMHKEF
jgi:putative endonuclease